ncbi:hexamerin-like isoform X2 [Homalodisca vitripennis]|nr:hexamerin-like isoform X2 [Homalodisca vitripennis]
MRAAVLFCVLVLTSASPGPRKKADQKFLKKQDNLLLLFVNIHEPNYNKDQQQLGNTFDFDKQLEHFENTNVVQQFQYTYKLGLLPRGEIFNYYDSNHLQQAIQLFDVLYFAKDYDTFYQVACWARDRVNEGQFVYALSVAIVKRHDTQAIALPPQSEVYPQLYINSRAIQQAQYYKQQGKKSAIVISNTTGFYYGNPGSGQSVDSHNGPHQFDSRISYFSEDKNLNQLFAFQQINYPNWFNELKYGYKWQKRNGERFYYYLQQLLARYNLERHANGLTPAKPFQFNENVQPGYNPQLSYYNGQAVPARPGNVDINNANSLFFQQLQTLDRRIADAIDSRQVKNVNGTNRRLDADNGAEVLGDLVQANTNSANNEYYAANNGLYGYLDVFRQLVGGIVDPYHQNQVAPGTIENESAALRDPVFYQIIARVAGFLQAFKNQLKPYKQEQLEYPGVQVQSVNVDKLVTYLDEAEVELYNAITYQQGEQAETYQYKARQPQLNYKPFNYNIQLTSDKDGDAVVRVFFGPQYDVQGRPFNLEQARQYFVEVERFIAKLKSGQNTIKRNSQQSSIFVDEQTGLRSLIGQVHEAQRGGQPFYIYEGHNTQQASFPQNLLLPRGSSEGHQFLMLVTVNSYEPSEQKLRI